MSGKPTVKKAVRQGAGALGSVFGAIGKLGQMVESAASAGNYVAEAQVWTAQGYALSNRTKAIARFEKRKRKNLEKLKAMGVDTLLTNFDEAVPDSMNDSMNDSKKARK